MEENQESKSQEIKTEELNTPNEVNQEPKESEQTQTEQVQTEQIKAEQVQTQQTEGEEQDVIQESTKKGSYITGTIGAVIGGFIGAIPWVLMYIYGNMIVAILAILIAGGAFFGYKICKGKIGKGLPVIISIISIIVVIIITTLICPAILLHQSGYPVTADNLIALYTNTARQNIRNAIIQDLVISLLFTAVAIAAIVRSINVQIKNGATSKNIKFNTGAISEETQKQLRQQVEVVKKACEALNCTNAEGAITKQELQNELEMTYGINHKQAKLYIANCMTAKLLKKQKGKYYYDSTDEEENVKKLSNIISKGSGKHTIIWAIVIVVVVVIIAIMLNSDTSYTIPDTNIKLEISNTQVLYSTDEEIKNAFGEEEAEYYDFIILDDEADKYEIYGQLVERDIYKELDFDTIIESDRNYYAPIIGEDVISEVSDKSFGDKKMKSYHYSYDGNDDQTYRAVVYLYSTDTHYLWINVYTDSDVELYEVDNIISGLFK